MKRFPSTSPSEVHSRHELDSTDRSFRIVSNSSACDRSLNKHTSEPSPIKAHRFCFITFWAINHNTSFANWFVFHYVHFSLSSSIKCFFHFLRSFICFSLLPLLLTIFLILGILTLPFGPIGNIFIRVVFVWSVHFLTFRLNIISYAIAKSTSSIVIDMHLRSVVVFLSFSSS